MNHRMRSGTAAVLVALVTGCVSAGAVSPSASTPPIRFEIHVPDQVGGDQVRDPAQNAGRPAELTFINQSDRLLWVNTLARVGPSSMSGLSEVQLTIRGPSGNVPFYCKDKGRHPNSGDYALLRPGETITVKADMVWCYYDLFTNPGTYTAEAAYHDNNPQPPSSPPGVERVSEELIAEPVQFRVIAK
jgi:hypothetical protein